MKRGRLIDNNTGRSWWQAFLDGFMEVFNFEAPEPIFWEAIGLLVAIFSIVGAIDVILFSLIFYLG